MKLSRPLLALVLVGTAPLHAEPPARHGEGRGEVGAGVAPLHAEPPARPKLILSILVDQFRYDYVERFHDQFAEDGLKMLTDRGTFMTFARYNYFPTITGPGHASFFSGTTPSSHGIIANDWFDKRTGKMTYCVGDPSVTGVGTESPAGRMSPRNFIGANFSDMMRMHYQSKIIGISMKDRGAILPAGKKPAGAYWWESATGNYITSTYYRPELPDWVKQFNDRHRAKDFIGQTWDRLLPADQYPWPDDAPGEGALSGEKTVTFPHIVKPGGKEGFENIMPTPYGNQLLLEFAEAALDGEALGQGAQPDVLSVSFSSIDYCGHKFGPYSQEAQDIVLRFDRQLAELFHYVDKKVGLANVAILLTADHGGMPTPEFASGQGLDGQRADTIEVVGELMKQLEEHFGPGRYLQVPRLVEGNLYLNQDVLKEKNLSVSTVADLVREWALGTGKFQACYSREQLLNGQAPGDLGQRILNGYNAERSGDIVLVQKPYTIFWPATGTTHGSPYSYDTHVPVLFHGPWFKPGRYADEFNITDIVPTLCTVMHLDEPPASIGKPFVKILVNP
jgi:predicted AlkP superfamily pyrophosphatase or phosphodiesterase